MTGPVTAVRPLALVTGATGGTGEERAALEALLFDFGTAGSIPAAQASPEHLATARGLLRGTPAARAPARPARRIRSRGVQ